MDLLRTVTALRAYSDGARAAQRTVALVPTMGALHDGHLALVAHARRRADLVIVSIFVNPTQFGPTEDLASYPRTLDADLAKCRDAGVDAVFAPPASELYPDGAQTTVEVRELAKPLCGASRPHFFGGVATVVAKLLVAARPHVAIFGEKDYQQLQVVRRLARDLLLDVEIASAPIVREADGLAMSSRNVHLDPAMRGEALALVRALDAAEAAVASGERSAAALLETVRKQIGRAPHASLDYAELRDPATLAEITTVDGPTLLALAVRFPTTTPPDSCSARSRPRPSGIMNWVRLIDNRVLLAQPPAEDDPR
jgi:pantoate--beta-alanine ligase